MKYIAYKTAKNDPNYPDGFITEHFETDQETLEGYTVSPLEIFNILFQNNVNLVRTSENARGIVPQHPTLPFPVLRPASEVEQVPVNFVPPSPNTPAPAPAPGSPEPVDPNNQELFNQFLAWVAAGKPPANNT